MPPMMSRKPNRDRLRQQVADVMRDTPGGLLTRTNLLAQRHNAEVVIQHAHHEWVVAVAWEGVEGASSGAWARSEGKSLTGCLIDVLKQVRA